MGQRPYALLLVPLLSVAASACDTEPERRAYVERLGADTLAVEVLTHTEDRIEGELLIRSPVTRLARYRAILGSDGTVDTLLVDWTTPSENPDGPAPARTRVFMEGERATVIRETPEATDTTGMSAPAEAIPSPDRIPLPVVVWEQAVRQARAAGADPYRLVFLLPGRPQPLTNALHILGGDTVAMDFFGSPMVARADRDARILEISGRRTTMKVQVTPAEDPERVDVAALAADYASRDARGEGIGPPSPRDTVRAFVGEASFLVDYGRPARRGRTIWGELVPYGEVWRTGANAATHLSVDRPVRLGGRELAPGTYTLWSRFAPEEATLIVSEQTGQWGTQYDSARDLFRVPMRRRDLEEPVERFTIDVLSRGILRLSWADTAFEVPIEVSADDSS